MANWRQDGIHLVFGFVITLAIFGSIAVIAGLLLLLLSVLVPIGIQTDLQERMGRLQLGLLALALFEAGLWLLLLRVDFVSRRWGQRLAIIMGAIALFLLMTVLFSR
ncbi:MAG: hypothetical protein IGS50_13595 [Synechococcales cyanobacterium C42_A2020_086]|jgi:hypothetical protein|nr:hypothetical protein [Synechococcales cyanobacterium C42_A2020_086]